MKEGKKAAGTEGACRCELLSQSSRQNRLPAVDKGRRAKTVGQSPSKETDQVFAGARSSGRVFAALATKLSGGSRCGSDES